MEGQVVRLAAELGISRRLLFPGFLRGEELQRMYGAADLYVLPSVSEPFGITPLEALAAGTPVMVSKQSGVSEVLSHALKVDFWDIEEMANQVVAVLRHPSLHETLTRYGTEEVKNVSWPRAAERCLELYHRLTPEVALA
jgi:glycosyltransferase involved in cell wall biosynthesis